MVARVIVAVRLDFPGVNVQYIRTVWSPLLGTNPKLQFPWFESLITFLARAITSVLMLAVLATPFDAQQSFPVTSTIDEPSIAGRPVAVDSNGKLLPWPMPDNTGYAYSSYFLSRN